MEKHSNRESYRLTAHGQVSAARIGPSASSHGQDEDDESDLEVLQSGRRGGNQGQVRRKIGTHRRDATASPIPQAGKRRRPVLEATGLGQSSASPSPDKRHCPSLKLPEHLRRARKGI